MEKPNLPNNNYRILMDFKSQAPKLYVFIHLKTPIKWSFRNKNQTGIRLMPATLMADIF